MLGRINVESLYVNTVQMGNRMGLLREQYAEGKKVRLQHCCNQVWTTMVGGFHGMLLLSSKHSRSLV